MIVKKVLLAAVIITFCGSIDTVFSKARPAEIFIIVNKSVPDHTLSERDVKNIFLGRKIKWSNNKTLVFVVIKESDIHRSFCKRYLGKTSSQFSAYWKRMLFAGTGYIPQEFNTESQMIEYVARTEGAIGYISFLPTNENIKVVTIIEK